LLFQTPAPPPELYHAGITYYNPQPQIQRQIQPMIAPKRTKTVLQLVEPPEKAKSDRPHHFKDLVNQEHHSSQSQSPPAYAAVADLNIHGHVEQSDLVQQFENVSIVESHPQLQPEEHLEILR
jgi:hypothetical protein